MHAQSSTAQPSDEPDSPRVLVQLSDDVQCRPVVELYPGAFGPYPAFLGSPWTDEQCDRSFHAGLAGSGIVDLHPVTPRSWMVFTDDIAAPHPLRTILEVHFGADGLPSDLDELAPLTGGLALIDRGEILLLPRCCADLGDIAGWKAAAARRSAEPEMLWIGHPWLTARFEDGALLLDEEREYPGPDPLRTFRVQPAALERAISGAERAVDGFLERISATLGAAVPPAVGSILVGRSR